MALFQKPFIVTKKCEEKNEGKEDPSVFMSDTMKN